MNEPIKTPREFAEWWYSSVRDKQQGTTPVDDMLTGAIAARDAEMLEAAADRAWQQVCAQGHTGVSRSRLHAAILGKPTFVEGQLVAYGRRRTLKRWLALSGLNPCEYEPVLTVNGKRLVVRDGDGRVEVRE